MLRVHIGCFHGHSEDCLVERIQLYYLGQPRVVEMAWVKWLLYHTLLGCDVPAFQEVVAPFLPDSLPWAASAEEGAVTPGPSRPHCQGADTGCLDPRCLKAAQEADASLDHLRGMESVSDGQVTDERRAGRWPRIMVVDGMWWRAVGRDPKALSQVLLSSSFRQEALESIHDHLWAGHRGVRNTQEWLERFWPALKKDVRTHCRFCPVCQRYNKKSSAPAPLQPLPL